MSLESVRTFLSDRAPDLSILETDASSATVAEAARAHGVAEAQIAKTLLLTLPDRYVLLVARGDARLDNKKAKAAFGAKVRMADAETTERLTGHPIGGVCPFGLSEPIATYCDVSLQIFDEVLPAAGARNAALRLSPKRLLDLSAATWIDICKVVETT